MQMKHLKTSIVAGWLLILAAIAAPLNIGSAAGWLLLLGLGLFPPMMLFRIWQRPAPTVGEHS